MLKPNNSKGIKKTELLVELAKENQKHNNPYKNKIINKITQLLAVMKYGEEIEERSHGKDPNWESVYNYYLKKEPDPE